MALSAAEISQVAKELAPALMPALVPAVTKAIADQSRGAPSADPLQTAPPAPGATTVTAPAFGTVESRTSPLDSNYVEINEVPRVGKRMIDGTGINLARWVKAKATAALYNMPASEVAKRWGYNDVAKALQQNLFTAGGSLVHEQYAGELVPLLRNKAVVRKAGARQIPLPSGNMTWDRQTGTSTAYYVGETVAPAPSEPSTDQFKLQEKKMMAQVIFSNDLLRNASIAAEEWVRDDLVKVVALKEDSEFLRGDGASGKPLGLRWQIASGNRFQETISAEGAPTLAEVLKDLAKARKLLRRANADMSRMVWLASPNFEAGLDGIASPGGDGTNMLSARYALDGSVRGIPVFITNQISIDIKGDGSGDIAAHSSTYDRSEIYLLDMDEVVIGDSMALEVEVFANGTWDNGSGTAVAGASKDMSMVRAISKHDIGMLHDVGGVVITDSSWGQ